MQVPTSVKNNILLPHQRIAIAWMLKTEDLAGREGIRGGILADQMGLGKTATVIWRIYLSACASAPDLALGLQMRLLERLFMHLICTRGALDWQTH